MAGLSQDEIRRLLESRFNDTNDRVVIDRDKYKGWRVLVVSEEFSGASPTARRDAILSVISDEDVAALVALAPEEEGDISCLSASSGTPAAIWEDAFANAETSMEIPVRLAASQMESLNPPVVATFYSLRGGIGRSTALVKTAFCLAKQGLSVLCIDMDLEAPGLADLFGVAAQLASTSDIVKLLTTAEILGRPPTDLSDNIIEVPIGNSEGRVELLAAGVPSADYARRLALLDPTAWYREDVNPLRLLMESVRNLDSVLRPDVVLVDARTGISPISAPLLLDIADVAIVGFYPHPQAREGTKLLTRALLGATTERGQRTGKFYTPEPRFLVSPVPVSAEGARRAEDTAIGWISEWLAPARTLEGKKPFDAIEEITQVVRYDERVASSDRVLDEYTEPYESIASWIGGLLSTDQAADFEERESADTVTKVQILGELGFDTQAAESQPSEVLREIFVGTASVNRALDPKCRLIIGRKGTGKTLLFRYLLLENSDQVVAVCGPEKDSEIAGVLSDKTVFAAIDSGLQEEGADWESAWRAIIAIALTHWDPEIEAAGLPVQTLHLSTAGKYSGGSLVEDVLKLVSSDRVRLSLRDWLMEVDEQLNSEVFLLFDGLDTSFGTDGRLRRAVVEGLLSLLNGQLRRLSNVRAKVFIRDDVFRDLSVPNKSHLRAESEELSWSDKYDYARIAIRQAWRSGSFVEYVKRRWDGQIRPSRGSGSFSFDTDIEYWPEDVLLFVWQLLVGERMSGGKTAFTQNWVWSRLADANDNHAPRHLVTLFEEAVKRERNWEQGNAYSRAIIRPRALAEALDVVSDTAIESFSEEFSELESLTDGLRAVGHTPFDGDEDSVASLVEGPLWTLGEEVGLLAKGPDGRFRVPELYRRGLGMSRQGQQ